MKKTGAILGLGIIIGAILLGSMGATTEEPMKDWNSFKGVVVGTETYNTNYPLDVVGVNRNTVDGGGEADGAKATEIRVSGLDGTVGEGAYITATDGFNILGTIRFISEGPGLYGLTWYTRSGGTEHISLTLSATGVLTPLNGIVIGDGDTVGQAAGPLLTFDDTGNELQLTGAKYLVGHSVALAQGSGIAPGLQVHGVSSNYGMGAVRYSNDASSVPILLSRSRSGTVGTVGTALQNNDSIGRVEFSGDDGTDMQTVAARIVASVDGTVSSNIVPGRIEFQTAAVADGIISTRASIQDDGTILLGDQTTNYLEIQPDGLQVMHGTARVTKMIDVNVDSLAIGGTPPTETIVGNYLGYAYTIDDDSVLSFTIPKDWDSSTNLSVVIVWTANEAYVTNSGEIQWRIQWSATPNNSEAINSPTHTGTIDYGDQNLAATAYYITRSSGGSIAAASLAAGDRVGMTLDRIALDDGSNPDAVEPIIIGLEISYTSNCDGTGL